MQSKEIWKDIPNYKGYYQVSNLGNVKSLKRVVYKSNGRTYTVKERILKANIDTTGYLVVQLSKDWKAKTFQVHKLVAMAFLGHKRCGYERVVHHIDNNSKNNRLDNLEVVTQRENSHTHHVGTSKYKGVSWYRKTNKWESKILYNGKRRHLGYFEKEIDAHNAYQNALNNIINN